MNNVLKKKEKLDTFLKSRKRRATREHANEIIKILSKKAEKARKSGNLDAGWIRSNELLKRTNELLKQKEKENIAPSSFFHLINELENIDILVKKEGERGPHDPGKKIVWYRIQAVYRDIDLMSHEEHLAKHQDDAGLIIRFTIQSQLLGSELEKCCKLLDINYEEKMKEIGEGALEIWNKNYKETFGEWE